MKVTMRFSSFKNNNYQPTTEEEITGKHVNTELQANL